MVSAPPESAAPVALGLALDLAALPQREPAGVVERRVGEGREHVGDLARPELAGQVRQADLEGHAPLHAPEGPDEGVDVLRLVRREVRDLVVQLRARHLRARHASREEDQVGHVGVRRERLPQERAGAEQRAHGADAERIVGEGADVRPGRDEPREEGRQQAGRLLGVRGVGQRADEASREGRIVVAGAGA